MADPRDDRPQPQYGEYAPEGWQWNPEDEPGETAQGGQAPAPAPDPLLGVPHNLGVPGAQGSQRTALATPQRPSAPARPVAPERPSAPTDDNASAPAAPAAPERRVGDPPPYRADEPYRAATQRGTAQAPASAAVTQRRRSGDIAVTVALLVLGAIGALWSAATLFPLPSTLVAVADALDIADFTVASWVSTFSTVSALSMFALYAIVLVFSIQRMRAGKLTFWAPLTAGVIAVVLTFILTAIGMASSPELIEAMQDPDAAQKLIDYMTTMQQP